MELKKVIIENFKSIKKIEFEIKKYGNSYTTYFLGLNESGKSNILQAMSYLKTPRNSFDYGLLHNQRNDPDEYVDIWFHLNFKKKDDCISAIRKLISDNEDFLYFEVENVIKNVFLAPGDDEFIEDYEYDLSEIADDIFIKKTESTKIVRGNKIKKDVFKLSREASDESFLPVTEALLRSYFEDEITGFIGQSEPSVTFWTPSDKYLISDVDLKHFKNRIERNKPLKNIFVISGYKNKKQIQAAIESISNDLLRRKLMKTLSSKTTNYVKKIWNHNVIFDIEISENGKCVVSIQDAGPENINNFHGMNVRSDGFKQFISLILSLSVETKELSYQDNLILLDEPELHLHPSGIRDLGEELLEIGKNNYLFASTHSPFLIDKKHKERNIIIRKNASALTEKELIQDQQDLKDDEVLDVAFGIDVYKDLLFPHRILVEGLSDVIILKKAFYLLGLGFGVTNGAGSNIVQMASKFNQDGIGIMVLVDDDSEGRKYKEKIIAMGGKYNNSNVVTLKDMVNEALSESTIEDLLDKDFVFSKFGSLYKSSFNEQHDLVLDDSPCVEQIKIYLQKKKKNEKEFLDDLKKSISDTYMPNKKTLAEDSPLLKQLAEKIQMNMNQ